MNKREKMSENFFAACFYSLCVIAALLTAGCDQLEKPKPEPFYAESVAPPKQEFRWSNGKLPKSFDPALAAASPETDIIRALYDGLTETDAKTLEAVPAIAFDWKSSDDDKTWIFRLRRDAKWTNGKNVTAQDFVRSWTRLAAMGEKVPQRNLLKNIVGMPDAAEPKNQPAPPDAPENVSPLFKRADNSNVAPPADKIVPDANSASKYEILVTENLPKTNAEEPKKKPETKTAVPLKPGVEAVGDYTLRVLLIEPDKDFPKLAAHPIFRPIYGDGSDYETAQPNVEIVTNGAFEPVSADAGGITLQRSESYWNRRQIGLERVRLIPTENAEKALEAYKDGELDAVTNADFEPLALKLLQPFDDFQRTAHGALNFYEFNRKHAPFDDRRVREALAISIERERLTQDQMNGVAKPAMSFLPFEDNDFKLTQNKEKAQNLLIAAGFADGANMPVVRLVVNRNDLQQKIARSVARMWKNNLNVETEIVAADNAEMETRRKNGDYDLIRRGVVLATDDETANMLTIFEPKKIVIAAADRKNEPAESAHVADAENFGARDAAPVQSPAAPPAEKRPTEQLAAEDGELFLSEESAIIEFPAIPLYFPTSYSLVKPYVQGFEINVLGAPSLKSVTIDNNWQPKNDKKES